MTIKDAPKKGLVKISWENIRSEVQKIEPKFTKLVDKLTPDDSFPIYIAYYPYGAIEADTKSSLFPKPDGSFFRLTDADAPRDIVKNLGYSISSAPLGMVLDKQLELFIDLKQEQITIPWLVYTPGMFFPYSAILSVKHARNYAPNGLLSSTAGARSVFMLPNIGSSTNHYNLQKELGVMASTPKSLYNHWEIFKEITNGKLNSPWRCSVLYFSEKWINKLHNDKAWIELKQYLHELAWKHYEYEKNRVFYEMTFSRIQKRRNLKPNPYLADTARHLFATALGAAPGYIPALDEQALPLRDIQKAYVHSYKLKKYLPTVMVPSHYIFETNSSPVYYSLQNPSTYVFSPKSREVTNILFEIRELENILRVFVEELSKSDSECSDTILGQIAKEIKFSYYHSKSDRFDVVKTTKDILKQDNRFLEIDKKLKIKNAIFSSDATFLRGCISISKKLQNWL